MPALARDGNHGNTERMDHFETSKLFLMGLTGLSKDALHIYVALAIFFGSCLILNWKVRQWEPWLLVLFFTLLGEFFDIQGALNKSQEIQLWGNWHDVWNSMLAPTVLMLLNRFSTVFAELLPKVSPKPAGDKSSEAAAPIPEKSGDQP